VSDDFLSRWSRRKIEARKPQVAVPEKGGVQPTQEAVAPVVTEAQPAPAPLPPVESLTPESDFSPFMKADVDPSLRRAALKTLFQDPRHNIMDGLDVYIDDYSKPDPLPEGWLEQLNVTAYLGDKHPAPAEAAEDPAKVAEKGAETEAEQDVAAASPAQPEGASTPESPSSECKDPSPPQAG
jgi:hypothetical protein